VNTFLSRRVVSSLGQGSHSGVAGSIARDARPHVRIQKFDPYLNVDPGTMSRFNTARFTCWRTARRRFSNLGHYERFTSGKLSGSTRFRRPGLRKRDPKERRGDYWENRAGIPHVTNEIKDRIYAGGKRHRHSYHGDRRHDRRHRGPAVSRGDAAIRARGRRRT